MNFPVDQAAGQGNQFLVMTTTFKNIDNESRMITDGSVFINLQCVRTMSLTNQKL